MLKIERHAACWIKGSRNFLFPENCVSLFIIGLPSGPTKWTCRRMVLSRSHSSSNPGTHDAAQAGLTNARKASPVALLRLFFRRLLRFCRCRIRRFIQCTYRDGHANSNVLVGNKVDIGGIICLTSGL